MQNRKPEYTFDVDGHTIVTTGKKLIRFNQCKCARKDFCRMFGQDPSCDEIVPDYTGGSP